MNPARYSNRLATATLLGAALAWNGCTSTTLDTHLQPESAPLAQGTSVAVVPFENLSASRNAGLAVADLASSVLYAQGYWRVREISGLQDDEAIQFRRLELLPWERQIGINTQNAATIGRALPVDCVVTGSIGEYGFVDGFGETAAVGLTVRLVRSSDAAVIWAGSLSRRVSTVAFSDESVHRLAHKVLRDLLDRMLDDLQRQQPAPAGETE